VAGAHFDTGSGRWIVKTSDGRTAKAKYLVLGTGFVRVPLSPCFCESLSYYPGRTKERAPKLSSQGNSQPRTNLMR
jgi:hypothetical protein